MVRRSGQVLSLLMSTVFCLGVRAADSGVDGQGNIFTCTDVCDIFRECGEPVDSSGCGECGEECMTDSDCCLNFGADATSILGDDNHIDKAANALFGWKDELCVPLNFGGWHWWNIDTGGVGNGGYGADGYDGTYAWYLMASPSYELSEGRSIGGFVFFAGREGDNYRQYYDRQFWFLDGYASFTDPELGVLKGGLVTTKFGLDNYLGFFGSAPYFDGFIQDPDYGISWEKTTNPSDNVSLETSLQFFIQEGEWNGGLRNHNSETVRGIRERNTLVARVSPTITLDDESTLQLGVSGLVGEIESDVPGFRGGTRSAWGTHADYNDGPLNLRGEVLQMFGPTVPARFASGGPSNLVTSYSTEAGYTVGPVKYRAMYSQSHDANPNGRQTIWSVGTVLQVTPNVRTFIEYSDWTVDGHAAVGSVPIIQGVQIVVHWHY